MYQKLHELKCKTLFSTHYHQLTEINLPRVKNYHLDIIENDDGSINFVRTLKSGSTDKSYGIHVAKLAGIPEDVIIRAFEILEQTEENDPFKTTVRKNGNGDTSGKIYDNLINGKKKELENLNSEISTITDKLNECDLKLDQTEKELENKINELENLKTENTQRKEKEHSYKKVQDTASKQKKYVQTSFFKPIIKKEPVLDENLQKLIDSIKRLDLNSITPLDAMKKLIELKEELKTSIPHKENGNNKDDHS